MFGSGCVMIRDDKQFVRRRRFYLSSRMTRIDRKLMIWMLLLCELFTNFINLVFIFAEMAEGNGEIIEEMETTTKIEGNGDVERTPDYPKLVEYGLDKRVCGDILIDCGLWWVLQ